MHAREHDLDGERFTRDWTHDAIEATRGTQTITDGPVDRGLGDSALRRGSHHELRKSVAGFLSETALVLGCFQQLFRSTLEIERHEIRALVIPTPLRPRRADRLQISRNEAGCLKACC